MVRTPRSAAHAVLPQAAARAAIRGGSARAALSHTALRALCPLLAALALTLAGLTAAQAQGRLDRVSVDRVRIAGGGRIEVWASAQDPEGGALSGLGEEAFSVAWDGRTPAALSVERVERRDPQFRLTVLIDPELARGERSALRAMLSALADRAGDRDEVKVAVTSSDKSVRGRLDRADDLADRIESLGEGSGRLYDALFREVQALSQLVRGQAGAVLLVTRGVETGSRRQVPEILALARDNAQHVPVLVLLLDPRGNAPEGERLSRFAPGTGGSFDRLDAAGRLDGLARRAVRRLRGAYVLAFKDPRWDGGAERHTLEVTVAAGGDQRTGSETVVTAQVMSRAWWQGALPWVLLFMVILLALAALPFLLKRPLVRLRVMSGGEKGFVYEIYEVPVTIGAAAGNDLIFTDDEVSRNHAVFERRGGTIELVDSNSENGTFVNRDRVSRRRVARGDRVSLGEVVEFEVLG
ncbi:MAG: FHA domain-containing protein [Candidatus Eisenbacteria bacterium]